MVRPILLLQEQNIDKLHGYQLFQMEKGKQARPRACILIPEEIKFVHLENYSTADTCSGLLKCEGEADLVVVSAYMDSNHLHIDDALIKTIEFAKNKGLECLISCDSNSQSVVWGNRKSNHRESLILDMLIEYGLNVVNEGSTPTYVRTNADSVIDLTLATNRLADHIDDWKVSEADLLSDHRLITFRINKKPVKLEAKRSRDLRRANWNLFRSRLKKSLCFTSKHYWTKDDLERESQYVTKCITDALDEVAPLKQRESKGKLSLWANPQFRILSNKVKAANRRRRRRPTDYSIAKYKQYRNDLKDLKTKIESERWQKFVETIQDPKDLAKFAKMKDKQTKLKGLKQSDTLFTEDCDIAEILRETHFPGSFIEVNPDVDLGMTNVQICDVYGPSTIALRQEVTMDLESDTALIRNIVDVEKVKAAIESFGSYKAAGPDEFSPIVLQNLPMNVIHRYVEMFRASLMLDHIPIHWRDAKVIFIPKTNRPSYQDAKAFRPISLASFQLKTLEKLLLWRIQETTLMNNPLSKFQHAFRKQYSTDTALSVVVDKIEEGLKNKQLTLAVFLDIKSAFDRVRPEFMIQCMRRKGVDHPLCNWYESYLKTRTSSIKVGDCSISFRTTLGTPQGAGCSPLAFCLCIDDYLNILNDGGTKTIAFADDLVLLATSIDANVAASLIQEKLKTLENWSRLAGLEFNTAKSNAMLFTNKRKVTKPALRLCNQDIEYADNVKYLGVTLTPKLSWTAHILEKVKSCKRLMYFLFSMVRRDYQMNVKSLKWLFTMCIRSKILYAAHIWASDKILETQKNELRRLNSLGCRLLAPCWKSTPTRTLEILWDMMPLHIMAKGTALKTFSRIRTLIRPQLKGEIGYQKGHLRELRSVSEKLSIGNENEVKTYKRHWNKGFNVNQFDDLDWVTLLEDNQIRYVYCDGSKINDNAGSGFIIRKNCEIESIGSASIGKHRTVYQSELKAVDLALDQLLSMTLTEHTKVTEIRIDNQGVLMKLKSGLAINILEDQIMDKLTMLSRHTKVILRWVKAHKGVQGNEAADSLAKVGAMDLDLDLVQAHVPLPTSNLKQKINEYMYKEWQNEWDNLEGTKFKHRNSKTWLKEINPSITKDILKLKRNDASIVIRLISGHSTIKEHLKRASLLDNVEDINCRLCDQAEETNEHLLDCPELRLERVLAFGTSDREQIHKYWRLPNIAEFCRNDKVKNILKAD